MERQSRGKGGNSDSKAPLPMLAVHTSQEAEAEAVAATILRYKENGTPLKDQAVLLRSVYYGRVLEAELLARQIPYKLVGGRQITEASHIKDVLAVLRVAENPIDSLALKRVVQLAAGIGPVTSERIHREIIGRGDLSFSAAVYRSLKSRTGLAKTIANAFKAAFKKSMKLPERLKTIIKAMRPALKTVGKYQIDIDERLGDLEILPMIARRFTDAREMLAVLSLNATDLARVTVNQQKAIEEPLTISTVHSAKGLEWEVVYLPGMNDGHWPSAKSIEKNLEEERRVLYVALTLRLAASGSGGSFSTDGFSSLMAVTGRWCECLCHKLKSPIPTTGAGDRSWAPALSGTRESNQKQKAAERKWIPRVPFKRRGQGRVAPQPRGKLTP